MTCDHRNVKWRRRDIRHDILVLRGCGIISKVRAVQMGHDEGMGGGGVCRERYTGGDGGCAPSVTK